MPIQTDEAPDEDIEQAAARYCAKLFTSQLVRDLEKTHGPRAAKALVTVAFTYGAAWALDLPEMITLGDSMLESLRVLKKS